MLISLSALDQKVTSDFSKLYSLLIFTFADDLSAKAVKLSKTYVKGSHEFINTFKLDKKAWDNALDMMWRRKNPSESAEMHEELKKFAKSMRTQMHRIDGERDIDHLMIRLFKDLNTVANSESEPAFNRLIKNVSWLNEPEIARLYEADVHDQNDILGSLKTVVKKMTGAIGTEIDADARANNKGSESLKEYNRLRRELLAVPKAFVSNLVRASGKKFLPVSHILAELAKAGIDFHNIPQGFKGNMDDLMNYYTTGGKKLLQTPSGEVVMNPKYDPKSDNAYVCTSQPAFAAKPTRIYTEDYRKSKNATKFDVAQELSKNIDAYRKKWQVDMKGDYTTDEKAFIAYLVELVYQTSARIGNRGNKSKGEVTYGITTLLRSHLGVRGTTRTFTYTGKSSQTQKHAIQTKTANDRKLIKFIDDCAEGKKRTDVLFTFKGKPISSAKVNAYLRNDIGIPPKATVHKFRTARGTHMADIILKSHPFKNKSPSQKEVMDWLKVSFESIADRLGHFSNEKLTVTTAIQNYIDPSLMDDFFASIGIRPPAQIQRAIDNAKKG